MSDNVLTNLDVIPNEMTRSTRENKSLIVTTHLDVVDDYDGVISLREALSYAKAGGTDKNGTYTISFDSSLAGKTFELNSVLEIEQNTFASNNKKLTINGDIDGDGDADITIDGGNNNSFFDIGSNNYTLFNGLVFENGYALNGGAMIVRGDTTVSNCIFSDNTAGNGGGAILSAEGELTVINSIFEGNYAWYGGAIFNAWDGKTTIIDSTLTNNNVRYSDMGGAVMNGWWCNSNDNRISVLNSVLVGNTAGGSANDIGNEYRKTAEMKYSVVSSVDGFTPNNTNYTGYSSSAILNDDYTLKENDNNPAISGGIKTGVTASGQAVYSIDGKNWKKLDGTTCTENVTAISMDYAGKSRSGEYSIGAYQVTNQAEPQSLIVTTADDIVDALDGKTSLREALAYAETLGGTQTISFADNYTVKIASGLTINSNVLIDGTNKNITIKVEKTGIDAITINGGTLSLNNLSFIGSGGTFVDGSDNFDCAGKLIKALNGNLYVLNCDFTNCSEGWAIGSQANAYVSIDNSSFHNNNSRGGNGSVALFNGNALVNNSIFYDNSTAVGNLFVCNRSYNTNIVNSVFINNTGNGYYGKTMHSQGNLNILNSIVVNNSAISRDVYTNCSGKVNIQNSIYTVAASELSSYGKFVNNVSGIKTGDIFPELKYETSAEGNTYIKPVDSVVNQGKTALAAVDGNNILYYSTDGKNWYRFSDQTSATANSAWNYLDTDINGTTRTAQNNAIGMVIEEQGGEETRSLTVTTSENVVNSTDGKTSLSEALAYAAELGGSQTISFNVSGNDRIETSAGSLINRNITFNTKNAATGKDVTVVIRDSDISGKSSSTNGGVIAGKLNVEIVNSTSKDNRSSGDGGVLALQDSTVRISDSTFDNNRCPNEKAGGTGWFKNCNVTIDNSSFSNCYALHGAGVFSFEDNSVISIADSSFNSNSVNGFGGVTKVINSTISITDTTFTNNSTGNSTYYGWGGGALRLEGANATYTVSDGTSITNTGNHSTYGGFVCLTVYDGRLASTATFDIQGTGSLTIGTGTQGDNYDSIATGKGDTLASTITKTGSGTMTINAATSQYDGNWIIEDGLLKMTYGGDFDGTITIKGGQLDLQKDYTFTNIVFELEDANKTAYITDLSKLSGGSYTINISKAKEGTYKLANSASNFNGNIKLVSNSQNVASISKGQSYQFNNYEYTLSEKSGNLILSVSPKTSGDTGNKLVVTTEKDVVDANDGVISLREALAYAATLDGKQTITFANDYNITLNSQLTISSDVVIDGGSHSISISVPMLNKEHSIVFNGDELQLSNIAFVGTDTPKYKTDDFGECILFITSGSLYVNGCTFEDMKADTILCGAEFLSDNQTYADTYIRIENSSFVGNDARAIAFGGDGFANNILIYNTDYTDNVISQQGNHAWSYHGGVVNLVNSTIVDTAAKNTYWGWSLHNQSNFNILNTIIVNNCTTGKGFYSNMCSETKARYSIYTSGRNEMSYYSDFTNNVTGTGISDLFPEIQVLETSNGIKFLIPEQQKLSEGTAALAAIDKDNNLYYSIDGTNWYRYSDRVATNVDSSWILNTDVNGNIRSSSNNAIGMAVNALNSYIVTTANDVVNDSDGVLSLREAVTAANKVHNGMVTVNISGIDTININSTLEIEEGVHVNGKNEATGNILESKKSYAGIFVYQGAELDNFILSNDNSRRDGGDIKNFGGKISDITVASGGDVYSIGGESYNITVQNKGIFFVNEVHDFNYEQSFATVNNLDVQYGGIFVQKGNAVIEGNVIIGGGVISVDAGNASITTEDTKLVLDISAWQPQGNYSISHGSHSYLQTISMLIDDISYWNECGSYSVTVAQNQQLGTYSLAGNARNFANKLSLTINNVTYENVLSVGSVYVKDGRSYSLSVNSSNVLQLSIANQSASSLTVTTAKDAVSSTDNVNSLSEALAYAAELGGSQTISFNVSGNDRIETSAGSLINRNVTFNTKNAATGKDVTVVIRDSDISGKSSSTNGGVIAGKLNVEIVNSTSKDNRSSGDGGVLALQDSTVRISDSTFDNNRCPNEKAGGTGWFKNCNVTIDNSSFTNCFALHGAGALSFEGNSEISISDSSFSGNSVWGFGGVTKVINSTISITDTTFTNNSTGNSTYYGWGGGAIWLEGANATYTVSDGTSITNTGNYSSYGGFICLSVYDNKLASSATFDIQGTGSLTIGTGTQSSLYDSFATGKGSTLNSTITKTGSGSMTINAATSQYDGNWVIEDGLLEMTYGGDFDGTITVSGGTLKLTKNYSFQSLEFDLTDGYAGSVYVSGLDKLSNGAYCLVLNSNLANGSYALADGLSAGSRISMEISIKDTTDRGALTTGGSLVFGNTEYSLSESNGVLMLNVGKETAPAPVTDDDLDDQIEEAIFLGSGNVTVTDSLSTDKDVDMYSFNVVAGEKVTLQTSRNGGQPIVDTYMRLFDANGNVLATDDDGGKDLYSRLSYKFQEAGTYYVGISNYANTIYDPITGENDRSGKMGEYQLQLTRDGIDDLDDQISEAKQFIEPGNEYSGELAFSTDVNLVAISVTKGTQLNFAVSSENMSAHLRLFNNRGEQIVSTSENASDRTASMKYIFSETGTYYIGVSAHENVNYDAVSGTGDAEGATGNYLLQVTEIKETYVDSDDQISEATKLSNNATHIGQIDNPIDVDMYGFDVVKGEELTFTLSGTTNDGFDSFIRLFNASGVELASDDDSGHGQWSQLSYTFENAGRYYLGISGVDNRLYNPVTGGNDVQSETGEYTLTVRNRIQQTVPLNSAIALGEVKQNGPNVSNAIISSGSSINMYSFTVKAGDVVWIDLDHTTGSNLDSYIRLFDSNGNVLAENDDAAAPGEASYTNESFLKYTFAKGGTYFLGVSAYGNHDYSVTTNAAIKNGDSTGGYDLHFGLDNIVTDPDDQISEATSIASGSTVKASIDTSTDVDMYKVSLTKGDKLSVSITLDTLEDSYLRLFDASGNEIMSNDDGAPSGKRVTRASYIEYTAEQSGIYYVGVSGFGNIYYNPSTGEKDVESRYTGSYSISAKIEASKPIIPDDDYENNDNIYSAADIGEVSGTKVISKLTMNDSADWYRFTLAKNAGSNSSLKLTASDGAKLNVTLYDSGKNVVSYNSVQNGQGELSLAGLDADKYYVVVSGDETSDYSMVFNVSEATTRSAQVAENYVVLFSGGYDSYNNRTYYYDSIKNMYKIVTNKYNVDPSHVYIIYADGKYSGADNNKGQNSDMSFASGSTVLSATERNLRNVFQEIAAVAGKEDHFLFYSFDHGSESYDGTDYLCGWNEMIQDKTFASIAREMTAGYQAYLMAQCYSGGILEDMTIKNNMFVATASDNRSPSTSSVYTLTGQIAAGFSLAVENALDSGITNTTQLYNYVSQNNPHTSRDNSQKAGSSFSIFATNTNRNDIVMEENEMQIQDNIVAKTTTTQNTNNGTQNKNGNYLPEVLSFQVLSNYAEAIDSAIRNDSIVLSAKVYDRDATDTIEKVEFFIQDDLGKKTLLALDNDSTDGWQYFWTIDDSFSYGQYTLSAIAYDSFGNSSNPEEIFFEILPENVHAQITQISLDTDICYHGTVVTVSGVAIDINNDPVDSVRVYFDADRNSLPDYPDEFLGLAEVKGDGSWSFSITIDECEAGQYKIFAEAVDSRDMLTGDAVGIDITISDMTLNGFVVNDNSLSWKQNASGLYVMEYSMDDFEHSLAFEVSGTSVDVWNLSQNSYQVHGKLANSDSWTESASVNGQGVGAMAIAQTNGLADIFFANPEDVWTSAYVARHKGLVNNNGNLVWSGTDDVVSLNGKNRFSSMISGSEDPNVLYLTDDANGDALFLDDIYTEDLSIDAYQARLSNLNEIRLGAGSDILDLTSDKFAYVGSGLTVRGGLGDDIIWANQGNNKLFGDAGNDTIIGATGNDLIVGGSGNDTLIGGGGIDIFAFGNGSWGQDTIEQTGNGDFRLWFDTGMTQQNLSFSEDNGDVIISRKGTNDTITVSDITKASLQEKIIYGEGSFNNLAYSDLASLGAFADETSEKIFEDKNKGFLASVC